MERISFCGDIRLLQPRHLKLANAVSEVLKSCDFNVINFEAPVESDDLKGIEKSGPCILQSKDAPSWLEERGWNVVSLANNHIMDFGDKGYLNTKNTFYEKIHLFGAGTWDEAYLPLILVGNKGKKIAFLACSHREFGCLHDEATQGKKIGYAWICHPRIDEIICQTKKEVDFLFIFAHAGVEELEQPLPEWRTLYKHFIDMGCDGVIASHPHIQMGHEFYKGKPIYYSLGNFCFQKENYQGTTDSWFKSIMVELIISDEGQMSVKDHLIIYDHVNNEIKLDKSSCSLEHINRMNQTLLDNNAYLQFINEKVTELYPWYMKLFAWSGLIPIPLIKELSLKYRLKCKLLRRKIVRKDSTTKTHLLNNLQCESHRWAIERALKLKYNI